VNDSYLPEKMIFGIEYEWVGFKMFESEDTLEKIYSNMDKLNKK